MRERIAFRVKTAQLQAPDRSPGEHLTIIQSLLGALDTRSVASIDTCLGSGTIQIAIAGGKG